MAELGRRVGRMACPRPRWRALNGGLRRALGGVLLGLTPLAWSASPIELRDDRGRQVVLQAPAQRVVSVLPALTETVCALQQCARLVGVDRYSSWPAAVRSLPQVGGGLDPHLEAIVALRPDVVLMAASARGAERLEALGLTVVALEPMRHADVRRVIGQVARLLGLPAADAERVWREIETTVAAAAASMPSAARGSRVYFEVDRTPYAAGESSFIGETLVRLGARNIVPAALGPFPKLNPEHVVRADPDVIMVGDRHFAGMTDRPGWRGLQAVRLNRVCVFREEEADLLVRPGPRLGEAARLLADCLARSAPRDGGGGQP